MAASKRSGGKQQAKAAQPVQDEAGGELIDMAEAIEMLKTSRNTFYRWLRSGKIKGMKVGRQWRFYRADIERFLQGQEPRIELPADIEPLIQTLSAQLREIAADVPAGDEEGVVRAVDLMLFLGVHLRASDIHLSSFEKEGRLRYRVDGVLREAARIDKRLMAGLVERWKSMARCDVHNHDQPQDGRILFQRDGMERGMDVRVCFVPSMYGESLTARILDPNSLHLTLEALHYAEENYQRLVRAVDAPNGLLLFTGPTGSGKTTSLYACLSRRNREDVKVMSVEDPVEYAFDGIVQIPVRRQHGVTFAAALRSMLRSDPDVIMVGEARDQATMETACQAALTGHLVLTQLHAETAADALVRLLDMGVPPFVIGDATRLILSQCLVRRLCTECSEPETPAPQAMAEAEKMARAGGLDWDTLPGRFRRPVGCPHCRKTGYRGRRAVVETLEVNRAIRRLLRQNPTPESLTREAVVQGMTTLVADGIRLAAEGVTTLAEVQRVAGC